MLRSHAPLRVGEDIDDAWRLVRRLGEGATSEVWLAREAGATRLAALKVLHGGHARNVHVLDRFEMEGRALPRVRHPNVVRMYGRGATRGRPYIAMEHVVGVELAAILAALGRHRMPVGRVLGLLVGVLDGLAAMHAVGVMHGDVKSSNVLVGPDRVVLIDLGLAHPLASTCRLRQDVVHGTPAYLAPELASGSAVTPNAATDVYAAGILAYELLTGRPPLVATSAEATLRAQVEVDVLPPSLLRPELPDSLDRAVLRALHKSPSRRTPTAEQLRAELLAAMGPSGRHGAEP